ncbi:hypothetical protein TTHERM_000446389 (macronuclear) [Tetrahymena thermophila SB210]|uniref:Uncharacterized protein n=1 Tax=Tetrahymena thermophila (strain SB210) TaxID=312017 RepID=W7X7J3_TETTS|nr:hypothetical protein TTHERM_000446389 [Tetrahymena thermophila SB210]EWS72353.1 hypothetical protein TTHERM_000446389 [Tetrahymena thermophila SB210]|eukprot:XP_012655130.1 hypothetical protein TTHERM_000446389 [Tetrahymena thermophila SB210]
MEVVANKVTANKITIEILIRICQKKGLLLKQKSKRHNRFDILKFFYKINFMPFKRIQILVCQIQLSVKILLGQLRGSGKLMHYYFVIKHQENYSFRG